MEPDKTLTVASTGILSHSSAMPLCVERVARRAPSLGDWSFFSPCVRQDFEREHKLTLTGPARALYVSDTSRLSAHLGILISRGVFWLLLCLLSSGTRWMDGKLGLDVVVLAEDGLDAVGVSGQTTREEALHFLGVGVTSLHKRQIHASITRLSSSLPVHLSTTKWHIKGQISWELGNSPFHLLDLCLLHQACLHALVRHSP